MGDEGHRCRRLAASDASGPFRLRPRWRAVLGVRGRGPSWLPADVWGQSIRPCRSMRKGEPAGDVRCRHEKIEKALVPDPEEAEVLKKIFGLALRGLRVSEIVAILEEEQIQTPSGEPGDYKWSGRTVRRMIQDDVHLGKYDMHTKERDRRKATEAPQEEWTHFENHHEALVTEEGFDAVQQNLAKHARKERTGSNTEPGELEGLLICASCGKQASSLRA